MSQMKTSLMVLASALAVASMAMLTGCSTEIEDETGEDTSQLGAECKEENASRECVPEQDVTAVGVQFCVSNADGMSWTDCVLDVYVDPCIEDPGSPGCNNTPLVLVFDDRAVEYTSEAGASFDLTGLGMSIANDWPTASTPWLALDRDGSGSIEGGEELFGSATMLATGSRAENGFIALRALDSDKDGRITPNDADWSRLLVWSDRDANRASASSELASASSWSLLSIDLAYESERRCDARGNCEVERASFRYTDTTGHERVGTVVDVHVKNQPR